MVSTSACSTNSACMCGNVSIVEARQHWLWASSSLMFQHLHIYLISFQCCNHQCSHSSCSENVHKNACEGILATVWHESSWVITAVIVKVVVGHPRLPHLFPIRIPDESPSKNFKRGICKTPPGFIGNVRCGCVTTGICMEIEIFTLLSCHVLTQVGGPWPWGCEISRKPSTPLLLSCWTSHLPFCISVTSSGV